MKTNNVLHKVSHLRWVFLAVVVSLVAYSFLLMPTNLISIIGLILFFTGIQLGLDSLSDVEKMSAKEQKRYQDPIYFKVQSRIILFAITLLVVISSLFISLKFVFPTGDKLLFEEFFNLGIDCWAPHIGVPVFVKKLI